MTKIEKKRPRSKGETQELTTQHNNQTEQHEHQKQVEDGIDSFGRKNRSCSVFGTRLIRLEPLNLPFERSVIYISVPI